MANPFVQPFLKPYASSDLVVQTRARNLFWIAVPLLVVMVAIGVMTLFSNDPALAALGFVLALGLGVALDQLRRGRYRTATNVAFAFLLVSAAAAALSTRIGSTEDDLVRVMAFFSLGLSMVAFFGFSWVQGAAMAGAGLVVMAAALVFPPSAAQLALTVAEVNQKANPAMIVGLFLISGLISTLALAQNSRILHKAQRAQAVTEDGFRDISLAFEDTRKGLTISHRLAEVATTLGQGTASIKKAVAVLGVQADHLQTQSTEASGTSQELDRIQNELRTQMEDQAKAVLVTGSALEEITANIQSITASARAKNESIDQTKKRAQAGEARLRELEGAIHQMEKTAEDILSVVQVIEDISGRTNLLAMNASIEAAHAGNSGRGFAVVASEIRKLAEETGQNSRQIRETLDRNLEQVGTAVKASAASQALMSTMIQAFFEVQSLLAEQLSGMEELGIGTNQILETVSALRAGTQAVQTSAEAVGAAVDQNRRNAGNIEASTKVLRTGVTTLEQVSRDIGTGIETLQDAGAANLDYVNRLNKTLADIQAVMNEKKESLK